MTIKKTEPSQQAWSYLVGFLLFHFSSADDSGINAEQPQFTQNRLLQKKTRLTTSKNLETSEEVAKRSGKGQVPAVQGITQANITPKNISFAGRNLLQAGHPQHSHTGSL